MTEDYFQAMGRLASGSQSEEAKVRLMPEYTLGPTYQIHINDSLGEPLDLEPYKISISIRRNEESSLHWFCTTLVSEKGCIIMPRPREAGIYRFEACLEDADGSRFLVNLGTHLVHNATTNERSKHK